MKSDNLLKNINDEDKILSKLPTPNLTLGVDTATRVLVISGNFRIAQEISKIAYTGYAKNTTQNFVLSELYISFSINDGKNKLEYSPKYKPVSIISFSCLFVISNTYELPDNFNLFNFNVNSFKIVTNYVYGNNKISSIITLENEQFMINYPLILHTNKQVKEQEVVEEVQQEEDDEEEDEQIQENFNISELLKSITMYKPKKNNKNYNKNYTEHLDAPSTSSDPYATLYWLVPVSIIVCIGLYFFKMNRRKKKRRDYDL